MKIVIINGPNLNLLGRREVGIYGTKSMEQVMVEIQRMYPDIHFEYRQSNHEGDLIDWVQEMGVAHGLEDASLPFSGRPEGYGLEDASLPFSGRPMGYGLEDAPEALQDGQSPTGRPMGYRTPYRLSEIVGVVLNAGGYTHTSVALRDAVACAEVPVVEVHISDISKREEFRRISLLTDVCAHTIMGHGTDGYREAVEWLIRD